MAAIWYVAFLFSLTCHEAAHALVAKLAGDRTAYEAGQGTLNPIPHMRREPIGMIVAPLVTYFANGFMLGWASAPYDPRWQQRYPKRAGWMALAGPGANFILVILAIGAVRFASPDTGQNGANLSHFWPVVFSLFNNLATSCGTNSPHQGATLAFLPAAPSGPREFD